MNILGRYLSLCLAMYLAPHTLINAAVTPNRISLNVIEPADRQTPVHDYPVSVGMIFPKAELTSLPGGSLIDDRGNSIPFEAEATGWWEKEKRNIKWLLLHFKASTDRHYFFEPEKPSTPVHGDPIAREKAGEVSIDTGPLQVVMRSTDGLFDTIKLHGKSVASSGTGDLVLTIDDGAQPIPLTLGDRELVVEESTPLRACIKTTGAWKDAEGRQMARSQVRCEFHKGEPFIRIEHTLTWMVRDVAYGIRELSLAVRTESEGSREVEIGVSASESVRVPAAKGVEAYQGSGASFLIKNGYDSVKEGERLSGWMALEGSDGRSVALSLRHAWQRYPMAFYANGNKLQVQFSPKRDRLSFDQEAIMTPGIYHHPSWKTIRRIFKAPGDATHFYDNYSPQTGQGYDYTAEGAAFTHELVLSFHDEHSSRTATGLNSINQQPVVLRQDPAHAMQVPFMGFNILPHNAEKYPEIERAVSRLGKMSMGRWVGAMNFGLLRYGMVRWAHHGAIEDTNASFYRWMDNVQYNQQLIPWLLFMRGGERRFFDDAEIVGRYAMDMNVNHFNTRGSPTGYMAGAGSSLPFNPFPMWFVNMKLQKIHFLSYHYHLTGDRRAKEVMDAVIEGTRTYSLRREHELREQEPGKDFYYLAAGGRENYNMNVFWVNAREETWDPEIWRLAANNRKSSILGEYQPEKNIFSPPAVYVYDGLVPQQVLSGDEKTREVMLRHLSIDSLSTHGGVPNSREDSIGYQWAYKQTGDERYLEAAWEIARGVADLVPDIDFEGAEVPSFYPKEFTGNSLFRMHLMPILTGAELGNRLSLEWDKPNVFRDNFFRMWPFGESFRSVVYVRARQDGLLKIRCLSNGDVRNPIEVEVTRADGAMATQSRIEARPGQITFFEGNFTVKDAEAGEIFRVTLQKADRAWPAVISDAQVVQYLPPELRHSCESLGGAQSGTPVQMITRASEKTVAYLNRVRRSYTLRDAGTLELILRPLLFTDEEAMQKVGAGRMIRITTSGCRAPDEWITKGLEPYFAPSLADWFNPVELGWPQSDP